MIQRKPTRIELKSQDKDEVCFFHVFSMFEMIGIPHLIG